MSATLPMQLHQPKLEHNSPGFQKGHPRYGGPALFARVLPYFINVSGEAPEVASEAEC